MNSRPLSNELSDYFQKYVDLVPDGDVRQILAEQRGHVLDVLNQASVDRRSFRYAPGKWSAAEVVGHLNDVERVFSFRALWFARGFTADLPSFDQHTAAAGSHADARPWAGLVEEFSTLRTATLQLFEPLDHDAWNRSGTVSGTPLSVRALAYIIVGHTAHHLSQLRQRYFSIERT